MNTKRPLKNDGVLSRQLGGEWLLYDSQRGSVHMINSMAEFVRRMCDGSHTLDDIENKVRDAFIVPDGTNLGKDVDDIIQTFVDKGILVYEKV